MLFMLLRLRRVTKTVVYDGGPNKNTKINNETWFSPPHSDTDSNRKLYNFKTVHSNLPFLAGAMLRFYFRGG